MNKLTSAFMAFFLLFLISSCSVPEQQQQQERENLRIALTKSSKSYVAWILRYEDDIEFFDLYKMGLDSSMMFLKTCDGLILTGGEDVFPGEYGQAGDTVRCGTINYYRDSLEFAAIDLALGLNMPIIGVCRGEQIFNVSQGGSLFVDVPTDFSTEVVHRQSDWRNCFHLVNVVGGSLLAEISQTVSDSVTSNHHQGINNLGRGLSIVAYSADSLPEAIEWESRGKKGFFMAVQWHPERMDTLHPLSAPIAKEFLKEVELFKNPI